MAAAQGPSEPTHQFGETLEIDLVTLDVVAVDGDGRLVTDLTADEIEVREDAKAVRLQSFEAPRPVAAPSDIEPPSENSAAPSTPAPAAPPNADHHLVLFVDNAHIGGSHRDRFIQELWAFLQEDVPANTRILVASYGQGLAFLTDFTDDLDTVREALETALREPALQSMADRDQLGAIRAIQEQQRSAIETPYQIPCGPELGAMAASFAGASFDRSAAAVASLRFLVATLGGVEGAKTLVHVSDGIPLIPGEPVIDYTLSLCDGSGAQQGVQFAMDAQSDTRSHQMLNPSELRMDLTRFSLQDDLRRVTELATANRVRMFTIQASPPPTGGAESGEGMGKLRTGFGRFQEDRNAEDSLYFLAEETGGRSFLSGVGFDRDLDTVLEQITGTYSLAYVAPGGRDERSHRIEVTTTRPGVRILHPSHRTSKSVVHEVTDRLLAALHHGVVRHPAEATVRRSSAREGGLPTRVRLRLPSEAITVPAADGSRQGMLTLYLTALDADGTSIGLRQHDHPVFFPPGAPVPATVTLEVEMGTDLSGHRIAVAVQDQLQGTIWTLIGEPGGESAGTPGRH